MQELSNARILSVGQDGEKLTKKLGRTGKCNILCDWSCENCVNISHQISHTQFVFTASKITHIIERRAKKGR